MWENARTHMSLGSPSAPRWDVLSQHWEQTLATGSAFLEIPDWASASLDTSKKTYGNCCPLWVDRWGIGRRVHLNKALSLPCHHAQTQLWGGDYTCLLQFTCLERSQFQLQTRPLSVEQSPRSQMSKWRFSLLALKAAVQRTSTASVTGRGNWAKLHSFTAISTGLFSEKLKPLLQYRKKISFAWWEKQKLWAKSSF